MSVSASLPPCWLYNTDSQSWEPFQSLTVKLYDDQQVSRFENSNSLSNENITKVITYDYIAYFSRVVPSIILNLNKASNLEPQSETRDQQCLSPNQINCILVLEDLPLRYCPVYHDDQFILIGFQVASLAYEETNHELMKVKDIIYQVHYKLNYSKEALAYQVSKRVQKIIYKTVKYALCNLAELFNIHQSLRSHEKLESLQRMCQDPNFYEYLKYIIHSPSFLNDLTSLAYKTILQIGLYPCCVELNTMDEIGLWLKIKDLVTNSENAPYGANYHASLCMGNYRYSLVFEFGDKEKQGLQISFEGKRKFSFKNRDFQYFRVPVLDFFPMDCWVREISSATFEVLNDYLDQINQVKERFSHKANVYKEALKHWVYGGPYGEEGLSYKLAVELYERFQPELEESQMFEKITQEICAAELKGYKYLSNNCQTVVNKIMDILDTSLSRHKKELVIEKEGQNEERKQNFLKFGAHFNYKFRFLGPFNLKAQSPFFHIFVDSDTIEMIGQIRGTNIHDHIREYKQRKHVRKFLRELEKSLDAYKKRYRDGHKKNIKFREADEMLNKIEVDLENDHGVIACLMNILCNELFQLRREIKIAKYCKLKLEERTRVDNRTIALSLHLPKRRALKGAQKLWQEAAAKLSELYSMKYKLSNLCRELRFYYYNTVRLANMERPEEDAVYYGFLLVKNPQENLRQTIHLDLDLAGRQFDFE